MNQFNCTSAKGVYLTSYLWHTAQIPLLGTSDTRVTFAAMFVIKDGIRTKEPEE